MKFSHWLHVSSKDGDTLANVIKISSSFSSRPGTRMALVKVPGNQA